MGRRRSATRRRVLRGRRLQRDRGSVAVEAALVTPLLLLLLFGIIEFGMVFKDWLTITSSVRAGARIASAEPRNNNFAIDAAAQVAREGSAIDMSTVTKLWVYKADASGQPVGVSSDFSSCSACVRFTWNASTKSFDVAYNGWSATTQNACAGDPGRNSVGVYLEADHQAFTGLIFDHLKLSSNTVMSLEPIPTATACK